MLLKKSQRKKIQEIYENEKTNFEGKKEVKPVQKISYNRIKKQNDDSISKINKQSNKKVISDDKDFQLIREKEEENDKMMDMYKDIYATKKKNKDLYNSNKEYKKSKTRIVDKSKFNSNKPKNVDRELDLGFLPKELLYNDKTYADSKYNLLAAIDILEKAQDNKNVLDKKEEKQENSSSFWSFFNPFKCGQNY